MMRTSFALLVLALPLVGQITFEPNVGQAPAAAEYIARSGSYRLDLETRSSRLTLTSGKGSSSLRLTLAGANPHSSWQPSEALPTVANYFHGANSSRWRTGIPTYGRVRETGLYPGIDLVYYGSGNRLEYDFVVSPHADPSRIRMNYEGAKAIHLDTEGNLRIDTTSGSVTQHKPVIYQDSDGSRRFVGGRFALHHGQISFSVEPYDHSLPLTIDPTLTFSSYLGGSGSEQGNGIAADGSGNFYVVGTTTSGSGGENILVRKFSPTGAQIYFADLGGSKDDEGNAIAVDSTGGVYIGGRTSSDDFPLSNALQGTRAGGADAFLLHMNPAGNGLVFSTYLGSASDDFISALAIDSQGAVYATGTTGGAFPGTLGALQPANKGGLDAFVVKVDAQGRAVYSTLLGGGGDDEGRGIAVDSSGVAYITGTTLSDSFPTANTVYQNSRHGGVDAFVTALNSQGSNLIYSTFLGGSLSDFGYAIAVDSSKAVYVAGKTSSPDFPTTGSNAYQKDYAGGDNDIFVAKFQPGKADVVYATYIGSGGSDEGFGLAVDSTGAAYITGDTDSDRYPTTNDATQIRRTGAREAVVTKLNPQGGALMFSTYLGGSGNDLGYGIALDSAGNAYVAGVTSSNDFPTTQGAFQMQYGGSGNTDAFFTRYQFATTSGSPAINNNGVVNGSSFTTGAVAPGSVISIFGTNFIASPAGATGVPLPTNLGGVSAIINGSPAPLFYAGPNQINAQIPYSAGPGAATVQINAPNGTSSSVQFQVLQAAPYLNALNGRAIAVDTANNLNTPQNPARPGSTVVLYFTGVGPVNAAPVTGSGSPFATSTLPYTVTVGGVSAGVAYLGLTPQSVGLAQANFVIPNLSTGDYPVQITVGGIASNTALIAVQQ